MQQAAVVSSTATGAVSEDKSSGSIPGASSGNFGKISTSRRALLGVALAAPVAIAAPAVGGASWDLKDWLDRWWALGNRAVYSEPGHLHLVPRMDAAATAHQSMAMMAELAQDERAAELLAFLQEIGLVRGDTEHESQWMARLRYKLRRALPEPPIFERSHAGPLTEAEQLKVLEWRAARERVFERMVFA